MKEKIRRGTGLILICVGIFLIGFTLYNKINTSNKQKELQRVLQDVIKDEGSEGKEPVTVDGVQPIALIEIPSIGLSQGLVEGITDDILQYYLGHFEGTANPGEKGNFAVAGHRVSNYSEAFINLYKAKKGDEIIVKNKGKEFTYKIEDSFVVSPDDVDVLENTKDATITLVTCTVGAKERYIVKGSLVSTKDI
ncbi:class D sortase [Clostridium chauvoei]|uniref:Class D sortase n=1 Tax=Clostridium chauvoei TaxID=46867 RepID=A0ABD4RI77_9CLOT|nr:sortase [Clostridium chauvoei]CDG00593.1 Putative Sortase family protein [Clostridium chauvoei JF4335]ATD58639.1 sortase [Clostridium chauvoei]MBX7280928.1 class D sortase [Clostridium chauvoei]MBX7283411.1 class D sortase [Clostridium chauvoei]